MAISFFRRVLLLSLPGATLTFASLPAEAAEVRGYGINRFEPSEPDSHWFSLESLDFHGNARPAAKLVLDWNHKPQQAYSTEGTHHAIVENQLALHLGASVTLAKRFRLGASLPFYAWQAGHTVERFDGTYVGPNQAAVGDLRLGADARLFGEALGPLRVGIGFRFWLPTGSPEKYTGDGKYKLEPRANIAGEVGFVEYAASIGYLHRGRHQSFVLTPVGDEIHISLGAGIRLLDDSLFLGPELQSGMAISNTGEIYEESNVLGSLLVGGQYRMKGFYLGLAAGPGLSNAAGTPKFRVLASASWAPR